MTPQDENPFASPQAADEVGRPDSEVEAIRREHLSHETAVRSIGSIYFLLFFVFGLVALLILGPGVMAISGGNDVDIGLFFCGIGLAAGALAGASFWIGMGLNRLNPSVRKPAIVATCIGLLAFPVGTLVCPYLLYLLLGKKGRRVLSDEYKQVVLATPHIEYRTPVGNWLLLALLVVALILAYKIFIASA